MPDPQDTEPVNTAGPLGILWMLEAEMNAAHDNWCNATTSGATTETVEGFRKRFEEARRRKRGMAAKMNAAYSATVLQGIDPAKLGAVIEAIEELATTVATFHDQQPDEWFISCADSMGKITRAFRAAKIEPPTTSKGA